MVCLLLLERLPDRIVFFADEAEIWAADKKKVILVREETSPEDLNGMAVAQGILTARGGMTSHTLLLPEEWENVVWQEAGALQIDYKARTMTVNVKVYKEEGIGFP